MFSLKVSLERSLGDLVKVHTGMCSQKHTNTQTHKHTHTTHTYSPDPCQTLFKGTGSVRSDRGTAHKQLLTHP